jgi:hypothetical protein
METKAISSSGAIGAGGIGGVGGVKKTLTQVKRSAPLTAKK